MFLETETRVRSHENIRTRTGKNNFELRIGYIVRCVAARFQTQFKITVVSIFRCNTIDCRFRRQLNIVR